MKKHLVLMLTAVLLTLTAQAQWKLGVKGGLNVTGFFTESALMNEQAPSAGFHLGAFMQKDMGKGFYFMPEFRYGQRNLTINDANDKFYLQQYAGLSASEPVLRVNSSFLEMPLNFQYRFTLKNTRIYTEIGPQVAFRLGGTFNGDRQNYSQYSDAFPFRWLDYGVGLGAGIEYKKFLIGTRWDWYLNWMGKEVPDALSGYGNSNAFFDMKYLNLNFSVGYVY